MLARKGKEQLLNSVRGLRTLLGSILWPFEVRRERGREGERLKLLSLPVFPACYVVSPFCFFVSSFYLHSLLFFFCCFVFPIRASFVCFSLRLTDACIVCSVSRSFLPFLSSFSSLPFPSVSFSSLHSSLLFFFRSPSDFPPRHGSSTRRCAPTRSACSLKQQMLKLLRTSWLLILVS